MLIWCHYSVSTSNIYGSSIFLQCQTLVDELSASHSTDLQQRAYELQALLGLDKRAVESVMPADASCEDIEVLLYHPWKLAWSYYLFLIFEMWMFGHIFPDPCTNRNVRRIWFLLHVWTIPTSLNTWLYQFSLLGLLRGYIF